MKFIGIYRIHFGENSKNRPIYFSKLLAFKSFLVAWHKLSNHELYLFVDDPSCMDESSLSLSFQELIRKYVNKVFFLGGIGNGKSYIKAVNFAKIFSNDEFIYFAEDDYLYLDNAFLELEYALTVIPHKAYFTLYDAPARYFPNSDFPLLFKDKPDAPRFRERFFLGKTGYWRTLESTTMTFGVYASTFQRDQFWHKLVSIRIAPKDWIIWKFLQGLGIYFFKFPKRKLYGPLPGFATHLEEEQLSPFRNWQETAIKTDKIIL